MRETQRSARSLKSRALAGAAITAVGVAGLGIGLATDAGNALLFVAIGSLSGFIGISVPDICCLAASSDPTRRSG